jgi:hypothetical protein
MTGHELVDEFAIEWTSEPRQIRPRTVHREIEKDGNVSAHEVGIDQYDLTLQRALKTNREVGGDERSTDAALAAEYHDHLPLAPRAWFVHRSEGSSKDGRGGGRHRLWIRNAPHTPDSLDEVIVAEWLTEILPCTGQHRPTQDLGILFHAEQNDPDSWRASRDRARDLDPIEVWKCLVEQDDVWNQSKHKVDRCFAARRFADNPEVRFEKSSRSRLSRLSGISSTITMRKVLSPVIAAPR